MKILSFVIFLFCHLALADASLKSARVYGGDEGGEESSKGSSGSKIKTSFETHIIENGNECANAIGAIPLDKLNINSIAKSIEDKLQIKENSRSIASSFPDSCTVFSSHTDSKFLKKKFSDDSRPINIQSTPSSNISQ